jgi:hypothetical protein
MRRMHVEARKRFVPRPRAMERCIRKLTRGSLFLGRTWGALKTRGVATNMVGGGGGATAPSWAHHNGDSKARDMIGAEIRGFTVYP